MPRVVVIGAGSAGAVIAARLSERPDHHVVVLEAGPDHDRAHTPALIAGPSFLRAMSEPGRTWDPLDAVRTTGQSPRRYVRGRGAGGSSSVNAMVALPGEPEDYDGWELPGWSWRELAPWFDRVEVPRRRVRPDELGAVGRALLAARPDAESAVLTRDAEGRRASTNDVYLEPARARRNLVVRGDAAVDRITFTGRRATGVRLASGEDVPADLVVLSAGAIHSPAVLLRSGVRRPGVGVGLQDHPSFPIALRMRDGHAAAADSLVVTALLRATHAERHDLQVLAMNEADPAVPGLGILLGALMQVHSRGSVRLADDSPLTPPVVDFAMLSDERDLPGMRAAVDLVEAIAHSGPMAEVAEVLPYDASDAGVRAALGDYVHATSTCRMGADDDPLAVVDARCRLIDADGVVVCDASVLPRVPRANTHLPTMALAERVASTL